MALTLHTTYNNLMAVIWSYLLYKWGIWNTRKLSNLTNVTSSRLCFLTHPPYSGFQMAILLITITTTTTTTSTSTTTTTTTTTTTSTNQNNEQQQWKNSQKNKQNKKLKQTYACVETIYRDGISETGKGWLFSK